MAQSVWRQGNRIGPAAVMAVRSAVVAAFGAIALALALAVPDGATADELPVWWSPKLDLTSIDRIDAIMGAPYSPEDVWEVFRYRVGTNGVARDDAVVSDCRSHVRLEEAGFEPMGPGEAFHSLGIRCFALDALSKVKPATQSHFQDFVLDARALAVLPPLLRPRNTCGYLANAMQANKDGLVWSGRNIGNTTGTDIT